MKFDSSTQTISWFRDRYREGTLELKPPFQRKPVWVARQKSYLIESILLNVPIPEVYIQLTTLDDGTSHYGVVDGQQRIRAVLQFVGVDTDVDQQEYNKFSLDKLDESSPWKNKSFADLDTDQRKQFYGYRFAVRYLETEDDKPVRDMFRRLNKYLTPLKPQELRNATYSGPFVQLANRLADDEYWAENRIVTPALIRRMGDVEFVSELLIATMHGPQSGAASDIDTYYEMYEDYEETFPDQRRVAKLFEESLQLIKDVFPDIKEHRWANKTDFYTLFVAIAGLLRDGAVIVRSKTTKLTSRLRDLGGEIDARLADDAVASPKKVIAYVRAVEKGANDKARRAARQEVLLDTIGPFFVKRKKK